MSNWGPWIGWNGGDCPVDGGALVECFCDETKRFYSERFAYELDWSTGGAYRVKKEPDVKTVNQVITHPVTALLVEAQCTYTDGKLTKIHWESDE